MQQSQKTIETDPHFAVAHYQLGQALEQKHRFDEAIAEFRRAIELSGEYDIRIQSRQCICRFRSERRSNEDRQGPRKSAESRLSTDASIALIYVGFGDNDRAMIWLNKAYHARFNPSILSRPVFGPLRSDPRFQDLLHRIGIPSRDAVIR